MKKETFSNAYYIKLGRNGIWEEDSIQDGIIRIGWVYQSLTDINNGKWSIIEKQLREEHSEYERLVSMMFSIASVGIIIEDFIFYFT
ncbi:MAG: hypothetical protein HOD85_09255 [Deltaproteobacteria bacterium]|nr:hypothetical protein [Deltaproteobacteria bacterium]MBT4643046.1 hypothetical protein [Deltaproteobacteria bacterium]